MAINFGDTIMEGSIEPSVQVQSPVQDNSGAVLAEALRPAAAAVGQIAGSIFKGQQEDGNLKIISSFRNELFDLADSVDQGIMTSQEATIRARTILRQYEANAPALYEDLSEQWTDFTDASGLGHVLREGTLEQQAQDARATEAAKLGYTMSEYDVFQARAREAAALDQSLSIIKAQGGILTETQRLQATQTVVGLADSAYPAAQRQINEAMAAIAANPNNKAEIAANLNSVIGASIAQLEYLSANADSAYITQPIKSLMATFNEYVNGTVSNAVLEGQIKNTGLVYSAMYANDPILGPIIAKSKLINDLGLVNSNISVQMWTPEAIQKLAEIGNPNQTVNLTDNSEGSARFSDNIRQSAGAVTNESDPELIDEINTAINDAVNSAYVHERSAANGAIGFKDIVELLGSNEVGAFLSTYGSIDAQYADQFTTVLKNNYEKELLPVVDRAWTAPFPLQNPAGGERVVMNNIPMNQLIEPRWNGNAVEFVPKPEYARDARVIQLANDTTSGDNSIGIPLNNLINAYANVTGVDAKQIYEEDFAGRLFGISEDGEEAAPLADRVDQALDDTDPENFSLGDFNPDTLEPIEEYTSQASGLTSVLPPLDPAYTDIEGIDYDSYLPSIRSAESGGNDSATNPTSTATGRYQFLRSTWNDLVNRYPNVGLTIDGRLDPQQQEVAIRLFTAENARYLKNNSVPLSNGTLYAAHFLGAGDAAEVLKADPNDLVSAHVPARVVNANKFLRGMTVAQFKAWANRKGNA